jgi:GAF domain-containing protein
LQQYGQELISTPLNTQLILQILLKRLDELFAPKTAFVFLRDGTKHLFTLQASLNRFQNDTIAVQFGINDGLAKGLSQTNDIFMVNTPYETRVKTLTSQEEIARLKMLEVSLCIPLLGSGELIGWVALGDKQSLAAYQNKDLVLLGTLANQTAIALANAQLLEQANRRAAELEALQRITAEIQAEAQPDKLLTAVVEQATSLLHTQGGMVYLLEPDNKTLKVVVSYNLDEDYCGVTLEIGQGIAGQVVAQNKWVMSDSYHNFHGRSPKFKDAHFGAVLGVPLRWGERVRGVLQLVHTPQGLRFSEASSVAGICGGGVTERRTSAPIVPVVSVSVYMPGLIPAAASQ